MAILYVHHRLAGFSVSSLIYKLEAWHWWLLGTSTVTPVTATRRLALPSLLLSGALRRHDAGYIMACDGRQVYILRAWLVSWRARERQTNRGRSLAAISPHRTDGGKWRFRRDISSRCALEISTYRAGVGEHIIYIDLPALAIAGR